MGACSGKMARGRHGRRKAGAADEDAHAEDDWDEAGACEDEAGACEVATRLKEELLVLRKEVQKLNASVLEGSDTGAAKRATLGVQRAVVRLEKLGARLDRNQQLSSPLLSREGSGYVENRLSGDKPPNSGTRNSGERRTSGLFRKTMMERIFPSHVAARLAADDLTSLSELHASVTVIFADIRGFTKWCSKREADQVIECLSSYFQLLDDAAEKLGVYKVETVGDGYVAIVNAPVVFQGNHAVQGVKFALSILEHNAHLRQIMDDDGLSVRVGVHTGPIVSGVIRSDRPRWQLFGDTINYASRLESLCIPGRCHISRETYDAMQSESESLFRFESRGLIDVKGKGPCETFFVEHAESSDLKSCLSGSGSFSSLRHISISADSPLFHTSAENRALQVRQGDSFTSLGSSNPEIDVDLDDLSQRKMLIVDDSVSLTVFLARTFGKAGYMTSVARDGLQALAAAKAVEFDIILCDLLMPNMNGTEFVSEFRAWEEEQLRLGTRSRRQIIFALTGSDPSPTLDTELRANGFDMLMFKSIERTKLVQKVDGVVSLLSRTFV